MSKRRLTKQQQRRIKNATETEVDAVASTNVSDKQGLSPPQPGIISAHFGHQCEVEDDFGHRHLCHIRRNLPKLVTGDLVQFQRSQHDLGVVTHYIPRKSAITRHLKNGQEKLVAANIDQAVIVIAIKPSHTLQLIDRYLVNAEHLHIPSCLVCNKVELLTSKERAQQQQELNLYQELGYQVFYTSCISQDGLDELQHFLVGKTCVFIGQSGVGKSSLIKQFAPEEEIATGSISVESGRGRHTTTNAKLYNLGPNIRLIDSPGIRDLPLTNLNAADIARGFIEFAPFLGKCRFSNCQHQDEPGCAIENAVKSGKVSQERYRSYCQILRGLI